MNNQNKIYGMIMRPCSIDEAGNEKIMQSTDVSVTKDFYKSYSHHIAAMQIVAECAKIYISKNWEKVKDWSNLEVVVEDANTKDKKYIEYFKYIEKENTKIRKGSTYIQKWLKKKDAEDKLRHNPIESVIDVVLDPSDGDFSLTINGRVHMWVSDTTVIIIANYIEQQLK